MCTTLFKTDSQFSTDETTTNRHATIVTLFVHILNCCNVTRFDNCNRNCIRRSYTIIFYKIFILADLLKQLSHDWHKLQTLATCVYLTRLENDALVKTLVAT